MRLYICIDGSYAGAQADAKAKGKGFTEVDVPTDKAGLIGYLNGMVDEARAAPVFSHPLYASPEPPGASPAPATPLPVVRGPEHASSFTAGEIEAFILETASVAQVERIFAVLGTRFAESRQRPIRNQL